MCRPETAVFFQSAFKGTMTACEDSDDEWFYESIKRYDELHMFEVQGAVSALSFCTDDLLMVSSSKGKLHEIWQLAVPEKLIAVKDAGLVKNRDFKILRAGYSQGKIEEMCPTLPHLVTSEQGGIYLYKVPDALGSTDIIEHMQHVRADVSRASLAVWENLIYSASSLDNLTYHSLQNLGQGDSVKLPCKTKDLQNTLSISALKADNLQLYVGVKEEGHVIAYDMRAEDISQVISASGGSSLHQTWTMDVSPGGLNVVMVSSAGSILVYDRRKPNGPLFTCDLSEYIPDSVKRLAVKYNSVGDALTVSGFGRNIVVLDFSGDCSVKDPCSFSSEDQHSLNVGVNQKWRLQSSDLSRTQRDGDISAILGKNITQSNHTELQFVVSWTKFVHDGHRGTSIDSVTGHAWHPSHKRLVVSADDTGQLQAWKYKC